MTRSSSLLSLLPYLFASCSSTFIGLGEQRKLSHEFANKLFVVKSDIYPKFAQKNIYREPILKKGERIRIFIEQDEDWLKVRAFKEGEAREQAHAKVILYLIKDIWDAEKEERVELLRKELHTLLQEIPMKRR